MGIEINFKTGFGHDQHRFTPGKKLMLGGVRIPHDKGLLAHSDGDVLLHAICDALLGALGRGDIGDLFPDTDEQFKDADSALFVRQIMKMMERDYYRVGNIDCLIIADEPKISPHKKELKERIAALLNVPPSAVNIKATRTEGMGALSDSQGIAAQAAVLIKSVHEED